MNQIQKTMSQWPAGDASKSPTHPHPYEVGWNYMLNNSARREGWEVAWSFAQGKYTVTAVFDLVKMFESDAVALDYVKRHAKMHAPICIKALAVIAQCNLLA